MLGATNVLGDKFGTIARIDWQGRESGWLADDLVVTCETFAGPRVAALSLKSGQSVSTNGYPNDFVELAWQQWKQNGTTREFHKSTDVIVLATGDGKPALETPWNDLLGEILAGAPARVVQRLNSNKEDGSQSSKEKRAIFSSFKPNPPTSETDEETVKLLSHVRWHDFDFIAPSSRAKVLAIRDCKAVLDHSQFNRADDLWKQLTELADELRPLGGTMTLSKLYARLKGFRFKAKAEVEGDWKLLERRAELESAAVKFTIATLPPIDRKDIRDQILASLGTTSTCLLVGESGSGKSALAKGIANDFKRVIWLTSDNCDQSSLPDLERAIGLSEDFIRLIDATPEDCCIVFDAIEGYGASASKVAAQLISSVQKSESGNRAKILLTSQTTGSPDLIHELIKAGFPKDSLSIVPVERPDEASVRALVAGLPKVGWVALSPDVQSLLRNLKMLDWFVDFAQSGGALTPENIGLTNLIDSIWEHWVATGGDKFARSGLLQAVATIEANRHIASVPVADLDHAEKLTLGKLTGDDLLRVQNNRIKFAHDLISDWARYNVLLDGEWFSNNEIREKYVRPRWARAVRLYAQRLLEQGNDDGENWRKHLEATQDSTSTGILIRDLFLEALFLAPNAEALLRQAWPVLIANNGKLLAVLLQRFLYAATYPDPRLSNFIPQDEDIAQFEHLMRVPYWPYWGPVLTVLHERMVEAVQHVPHAVAKVVSLWLRTMNFEPRPGYKIKWRREAAVLAVAAARKIQSYNEQGNYYSAGKDKDAYEAVLNAADELPVEVGQLCLELAKRRNLSPEVAAEVVAARAEREAERKRHEADHPPPKRRSHPISFPLGRLRSPWPDGPAEHVDQDFQDAILEGGNFGVLAKANPDAALETLLAVCIECPQHEYSGSSLPEYGLAYWQNGDPAIWWRGPFYAFFNAASDRALSFLIRLANFVASRFDRQEGINFKIGGADRFWRGDSNFFAAHYDGYLSHASILQSALMALEKWLYDKIERNEDISEPIERIIRESESLVFAGLLVTVGKRKPELFLGPLRPLVENWRVWNWDFQLSFQRANGMRWPMGFIRNEGAHAIQTYRVWVDMPHRKESFRDLLCREFLPQPAHRPFFAAIKADWETQLGKDGEPDELSQLIVLLDPDNYTYKEEDGKLLPIDFKWPDDQEAKAQAATRTANKRLQYLTFPSHCRKLLDKKPDLAGQDLDKFLDLLKEFHADTEVGDGSDGLKTKEDLVLGGIAVLVVLAYAWLDTNPKAMKWCRARLEEELKSAQHRPTFYTDVNIGNDKRDAFSAEAAIVLLAKNPGDGLARGLVARAITAFFYSTTALLMDRAAQHRKALGDDFVRIVKLVLEWSALRSKINHTPPTLPAELGKQQNERDRLLKSFVSGKLAPVLPDLPTLNRTTQQALDYLFDQAHPEQASLRKAARLQKRGRSDKQSPDRLGLDERLLTSAFGWINLPFATSPEQRTESVASIMSLLDLILSRFPVIAPDSREELEGYPSDLDTWVFGVVAEAIVNMSDAEKPERLWQPILDLGPHAHHWVARFFTELFTRGYRAQQDLSLFARRWRQIIEYGLASPKWDSKVSWHHRIDDVVREMLGLNYTWSPFKDSSFEPYVAAMADLFEKASSKWFYLEDVLNAFVHTIQQPAAASLAIKSIPWVAAVVAELHEYSWRHGLEEGIISYLGTCWKLGAKQITTDAKLNTEFFQMLNVVVARQSHPAIALRDRIAQQTQG